jgi:hypothetical protein
VQGRQGTNGTNGTNGTQGTTGLQGLTGTTGATGSQGTTGTTGTTGIQGLQGTQGLLGTQGSQPALSTATPLALGAASAGVATSASKADHVHPTTGVGLTASPLSQFAATTSAQLAGVISDETGSGALVFGTAPTLGGTVTVTGDINMTGTNAVGSIIDEFTLFLMGAI